MHTQSNPGAAQSVNVSESVVSIPTHGPLGRDAWPNVFFKTQWYAPFYPLDRYVHPAGPRHEQNYVAVTLENEHLRVVVLPELGGHVWEMYDKVCKEHLVYNNDVVKPTRIGFRSGWCAMGIEFNFPVAHSLQSVDPLPYKVEHHDDGAVSLLTWHRDRPRRIEMILRLTLRPGRRDLQVRASMYNPSPVRRPYDYWTNVAISARPETEFIYPTTWMQGHGSRKVYAWPIVNGEDMRFQRNYQKTISFFACDKEPGFFGCWWSDTKNGLAHVADPACCPGKKLFNWGKRAVAWLSAVTENAGPYAELQAGRFPTQADYQWLQPGQTDVLEESWFGYHGLGGLTRAGKDLAMHVTTDGGDGKPARRVTVSLHAVCDIPGAAIIVTADDRVVLRDKTDLPASAPVHRQVELAEEACSAIIVDVIDARGASVASHTLSLKAPGKSRMPRPGAEKWENMFAPLEDKDAATRSRIGETAELNTLWPRAAEAYESALSADPNCPEALLGLGSVCLRNAKFEQAAEYGQRLMGSTQKPWQQAGAYILGVAEFSQGNGDKAAPALQVATKHSKIGQMARLFLAMVQARRGEMDAAQHAVSSLAETVASMPIAKWVRAAVVGDAFAADPTSGWTVTDDAEMLDLGCERAIWAIRIGMPTLGEQILDNLERQGAGVRSQGAATPTADNISSQPLLWYLKAYLQHLQGKEAEATQSLQRAAQLPRNNNRPTYPEWITVLHWALQANPDDLGPHAYLAPLEYWLTHAHQAVQHWETLRRHNANGDSTTHYGLALALWEARNDRKAAAEILTDALAHNPNEERLYLVLDDVLVEDQDTEARGRWLTRAREHCGQTDFLTERYCHSLINQQRWREVVGLLTEYKFGPSHGLFIRRRMWLLAHHRLALECLASGDHAKAYEYGMAGSKPPITLGEDDMTMPFASPVLLAAAEACEKMGDKTQAKQLLQQAVDLAISGHMHPPYTEIHRARVLLKLGKKTAAQKLLQDILAEVLPRLDDTRPGLNKGHFHFLYALILETQGQAEQASHHFAEADRLKLQWANLVGYGMQWGFN
jgi:tetratricopeptide (TPR) repeat protein